MCSANRSCRVWSLRLGRLRHVSVSGWCVASLTSAMSSLSPSGLTCSRFLHRGSCVSSVYQARIPPDGSLCVMPSLGRHHHRYRLHQDVRASHRDPRCARLVRGRAVPVHLGLHFHDLPPRRDGPSHGVHLHVLGKSRRARHRSCQALSGAFGGLVAYGLIRIRAGGLDGWQWLYIVSSRVTPP